MKARTIVYIAGAVVGVYAAIALTKKVTDGASSVKEAAGRVIDAVNPASSNNLAIRGANAVTQAITGDSNETLGGYLYGLLHPTQGRADAPAGDRRAFIDIGGYESTATQDDWDAGLGRFGAVALPGDNFGPANAGGAARTDELNNVSVVFGGGA